MRRRVLITGSSGMLGIDLSRELRLSYAVFGMDVVRRPSSVIRTCRADIGKQREVARCIAVVKPDIVIHTAAWTDVDGCELDPRRAYRINTQGTRTVARVCAEAGILLVYISTDFIFDGKKRTAYREGDTPRPLSSYGDSKLQGERAVTEVCPRHIIVRTSWLYGACGKNFVDTIIAKARSGEVLRVVDDQVGSPTYTKDLARALHLLVDLTLSAGNGAVYGIYHITNTGRVSWYDYAKAIMTIARLPAAVKPISSRALGRPAKRPAMSVLDTRKFARATHTTMRHWKDALDDYITGKAVC